MPPKNIPQFISNGKTIKSLQGILLKDMSNVIKHLKSEIERYISTSKSVNVAVALTSSFGVNILEKVPAKCVVKIITGVNLPTPIDVLKQLRGNYGTDARVYLKQNAFFHPKVYIFRMKNDSLVAFIGSCNFTSGGLSDNIELAYKITNQRECQELLCWFDEIYKESSEITDTFLKDYKSYFVKWQKTNNQQVDDMSVIQEHLNTIRFNYNVIKEELIRLRQSYDYQDIVRERRKDVRNIRNAIDYKNNFRDFDVDAFLDILSLGHIIPTYKQTLKKAVKNEKMQKLCQMLCDDSLAIEDRYRLAISDYKVNGCGCNVITKILCVHNPKEYMLWNSISKEFLDYTQVSFERSTKEWHKYKQLCEIFKKLCIETDIENFAVLDYLLLIAIGSIKRNS